MASRISLAHEEDSGKDSECVPPILAERAFTSSHLRVLEIGSEGGEEEPSGRCGGEQDASSVPGT